MSKHRFFWLFGLASIVQVPAMAGNCGSGAGAGVGNPHCSGGPRAPVSQQAGVQPATATQPPARLGTIEPDHHNTVLAPAGVSAVTQPAAALVSQPQPVATATNPAGWFYLAPSKNTPGGQQSRPVPYSTVSRAHGLVNPDGSLTQYAIGTGWVRLPPVATPALQPQPPQPGPPQVPQTVAQPMQVPQQVPTPTPQATPSQVPQTVAQPMQVPQQVPTLTPQATPSQVPQTVARPMQVPQQVPTPTPQATPSQVPQTVAQPAQAPTQAHGSVPQVAGVSTSTTGGGAVLAPGGAHRNALVVHAPDTPRPVTSGALPADGIYSLEFIEPGLQRRTVKVYRTRDAAEMLYQDTIPLDRGGFQLIVIGTRNPSYIH